MEKDDITLTVHEVLESMGFDTSNRLRMQRQMAALSQLAEMLKDEDFQADLQHLRKWRMATEKVNHVGFITVITMIVSGAAGALWLGLKEILR